MNTEGRREGTYTRHNAILNALKKRDAETASKLVLEHVEDRTELLVEVLKESISRMHISGSSWISHQ